MSREVTVGIAQTGPILNESIPEVIPSVLDFIEKAAERKVNILSFCELFLTPFFPNQLREDYQHFFIEADGPEMKKIVAKGKEHGVALVLPFSERAADGFYNSALVSNSRGEVLGVYRKTHMPAFFPNERPGGTGSYEKMYFSPGNSLPVFDIDGHKVGIQICYDRQYPEPSRVLAIKGAEILIMPISYSLYGDPEHRKEAWEIPMRARAFENGVFVVAPNRVGKEGVRQHLGKSLIVDPEGKVIATAGTNAEELLVETIDLSETDLDRKRNPWWRDRRPDLYQSLVTGNFG